MIPKNRSPKINFFCWIVNPSIEVKLLRIDNHETYPTGVGHLTKF